jgi:hypothetical protein
MVMITDTKDFPILKILQFLRLFKLLSDLNSKEKKINDDQNTFIYDEYIPYQVIVHTEGIKRENNYNKMNKLFGQRPLMEAQNPFEKATEEKVITPLAPIPKQPWLEYLINSCKNWLEIWISFCNDYPTLVLLVLGAYSLFFLLSLNNWIKKYVLKSILRPLLQNRIPLWESLYEYWYDLEENEYPNIKKIEYKRFKDEDIRLKTEQY